MTIHPSIPMTIHPSTPLSAGWTGERGTVDVYTYRKRRHPIRKRSEQTHTPPPSFTPPHLDARAVAARLLSGAMCCVLYHSCCVVGHVVVLHVVRHVVFAPIFFLSGGTSQTSLGVSVVHGSGSEGTGRGRDGYQSPPDTPGVLTDGSGQGGRPLGVLSSPHGNALLAAKRRHTGGWSYMCSMT